MKSMRASQKRWVWPHSHTVREAGGGGGGGGGDRQFYVSNGGSSLVPRPHPLTRRNGLVNQVEFLGLVPAFATM